MESEDAEDLLGTLAMFNQNLSEIREKVESLTMDPTIRSDLLGQVLN